MTKEKIHQAFQNLFGGANGNNAAMPTPQFHDRNAYQIKAKPAIFDTPGNLLNNKPTAWSRSVFSPIPCKPQSECSILGVRGDRNTPYTPFSRQQEQAAPRAAHGPSQRRAESRRQGNTNMNQLVVDDEITPGQFLRLAQPVGNHTSLSRATPKNPTKTFTPFPYPYAAPGYPTIPTAVQSPFARRQTPKQFRMQAGAGQTASPPRHTTIINLYNQPISCSNFYQSGQGNNSCAGGQSAESNGSISQTVSPAPCKATI